MSPRDLPPREGAQSARPREKVAVIAGYAPSLLNFRGPLIRTLRERGHEVIAFAPEHDVETATELLKLGVRYHPVPFERNGLNPLADLRGTRELTALLRRERPDVVFAYTVKPVVFGSFAARAAGIRRIYSMITGLGYTFTPEDGRTRVLNVLVRGLYGAALRFNRRAIFQNPDDRAVFTRGHLVDEDRTCLVNGSGVDLDHYAPAPLPPGPPTFLLLSRLLRVKGVLEYVQAARQLTQQLGPGRARFVLVGPLDTNPSGITQADLDAWQAEGVVEYLGSTTDVRPALAACHVFVLPSYGEGVPRTVLEALATGRAVVTTDAPGCRETVVPGRNGLLIPTKDPAALAAAMRLFIDDPSLAQRMGEASLELARQKYDVRLVNRQMLEAFELGGESHEAPV